MKGKRHVLDRMADQVMDLDNPAYGDERERAVFMESSAFGTSIGIYVALAAAIVTSAFGLVLLAVVLVCAAVLPSIAMRWYARRRGVDVEALANQAGDRSTLTNFIIIGGAMVLVFAAIGYWMFTGQPLVTAPAISITPGEGFLGGMAQGAVIGGLIGGFAMILRGVLNYLRVRRG